ncbi:MAG TPA: CarD family transcriptional regulator [Candidatus Tectomicrobia bacterium]|jgi:CarD family transcriptional regulator
MISADTTFQVGDTVVYAMHGTGQIVDILTQTVEGTAQDFYRIVLTEKRGQVLVPVEEANPHGLRHPMQASEVPQVIQQLQQAATRSPRQRHPEDAYTWGKRRLREGQAAGLAEVRRFLHELEQMESITTPHMRQLRTYVYTQLPAEIAQALGDSQATADRLVDTALTSTRPIVLPTRSDNPGKRRKRPIKQSRP